MANKENKLNFQFQSRKAEKNGQVWLDALVQVLLTIGFLSCIFSMAQLTAYSWVTVAALPFILISAGLKKRKKLRTVLMLVCAACCILTLVMVPGCANGLRIWANSLFEASEAKQAYRYVRLELTRPTSAADIISAAAAVSAALGCLAGLIPEKYLPKAAIAASVCLAAVIIYFGIFPAAWAGAFAAVAVVLAFAAALRLSAAGMLFTAGIAAVIVCVCFAVAPGEQFGITALNERLRDDFALHTLRFTNQAQNNLQETEPEEEEPSEQSQLPTQRPGSARKVLNWKLLAAILLSITLLLILFLPAIWLDKLHRRMEEYQIGIKSANPRTSILASFRYLMRWLSADGFEQNAVPYTQLDLHGARLPEELLARYPQAASVWQEAAYSTHEMTQEQRDIVYIFMRDAIRKIWEGQTRRGKLRLKYRFALAYQERVL